MVTINYFPTSVQRLYRIGTEGEWKSYQNTPVWVNQDETIYAKGIDKYGNESRIISSYKAVVADAIGGVAYDGNPETYFHLPLTSQYKLRVDSSMQGKKIVLKAKFDTSLKKKVIISFYDSNSNLISSLSWDRDEIRRDREITIPNKTEELRMNHTGGSSVNIYEITPST